MLIVGLNGAAGAGKDTFAGFLVENEGYRRFSFADAVREAALSINPVLETVWEADLERENPKIRYYRLDEAVEQYGWDKAKRELPEVRRLLQVIGTEMGRQILGINCWVDIVRDQIFSQSQDAVITDLRFPNEAEFVHDYNGKIVSIVRPYNPHAISTGHATEQYKPDPDHIVHNDGSLEKLAATASALHRLWTLDYAS